MDSYRYWQWELKRHDFTCGQFGENFTLADDKVRVGDRALAFKHGKDVRLVSRNQTGSSHKHHRIDCRQVFGSRNEL
jgi:hypothetical protein